MVSIKVYNKEDKIKLLVSETSSLRIINIYKYDGKNMDKHSFTCIKKIEECDEDKRRWTLSHADRITYYDLLREEKGVMVERLYYTNLQKEHWRLFEEGEESTDTTIFKSGNKYEKKVKRLNDDIYTVNYKNGELTDFKFPIKENKINEYLKIISYE